MSTLLRFLLFQSALIPASLSRVLCATCLCLGSSVNGPNDNMDKHIIEVWIILIDQTQNIIKQTCESWRDEILWRTQRHSPSMLDHQFQEHWSFLTKAFHFIQAGEHLTWRGFSSKNMDLHGVAQWVKQLAVSRKYLGIEICRYQLLG